MYVFMRVCMCVCMYACTYACMYICMYACTCMHACMYAVAAEWRIYRPIERGINIELRGVSIDLLRSTLNYNF